MVVYTPCILDPVNGIATINLTLPEGLFCSDVMVDPSESPALPCPALPCPALPILLNQLYNSYLCSSSSMLLQIYAFTPGPPRLAYQRACQPMLYNIDTFLSEGLSSEPAEVLVLQLIAVSQLPLFNEYHRYRLERY